MKNQTVSIVAVFSAMLVFLSFAEELSFQPSGAETVMTPSELLRSHRLDFLPDGELPGQTSNTASRALHLMLMTNVVRSVAQAKLADEDVEAGDLMMKRLLECQAVVADKESVLYMLNTIPAIRSISTNDYARELRIADEADVEFQKERRRGPGSLSIVGPYRGPNTIMLERKWKPIFDHNKNCAEFRCRLVDVFASVFPGISRALAQKEVEELFDAVKNNDGLSDGEKKRILGGIMPVGDK